MIDKSIQESEKANTSIDINSNEPSTPSTTQSVLISMLSMIDIEHSILIDDVIGLIGDTGVDVTLHNKAKRLYDVWDTSNMYKVFNHFQAISSDGVFLFNEDCIGLGIIVDKTDTLGYMFILKDFFATNSIDEFFGEYNSSPGVIIYFISSINELYTNSASLVEANEKYKTYILDTTIDYIEKNSLVIRKHKYSYHPLDNKNNIFILRLEK